MYFEEEVEKHLKVGRYSLAKDVYIFLLFSIFLLLVYFLLRYFNTRIDVSRKNIYLTVFVFLKLFIVRFFLFDRYPKIFSKFLVLIFSLLSLCTLFSGELLMPISFIFILTAFFLLLILFNSEKFAFFLLIFLTVMKLVLVLIETEFGFEGVIFFEMENIFLKLIYFWFFLLLLYILFKGCLLMKLCQQKAFLTAIKYRYLANLEHRNRLLGKISKCILHDITTPISVISGYLKLSSDIEKSKSNYKKEVRLRESALGSLLYLETILNGSMNIVKRQSKRDLFNPDDCLLEMIGILERRIERGNIEVKLNLNGKGKLNGDRCSFCRIFLNLLVNSIEELERSRKRKRMIEINSMINDNHYLLSIRDNGRGLTKEFLEKLKNKNIDLDYEEEIGIGLFFVCITIRRKFKGDIMFSSVKWKYTYVELSFPL
jgi:signal transduction histidine kinase